MLARYALLAALLFLASARASEYRFFLDGEAIHPDIFPVSGERLGAPARGDVGRVLEFPVVLQGPGHYHFRNAATEGKLYARINDGAERCVAVRVPRQQASGATNPLETLAAQARRQLWGVRLEGIPPNWPAIQNEIDWSNAVLSLGGALPASRDLPPNLHYFSFRAEKAPQSDRRARDYRWGELRFLEIELREHDVLSALPISKATRLRNLSLKGGTFTDLPSLRANQHLRFLKIRSLKGLDSLEFTRSLPELRVVKVDETEVADLSPLAGLKDLRLLSVNATKIDALPPLDALPALRDLRLHSTPLAKKQNLIAPLRPKMNILVKNWDPSIRAFEAHDLKSPPPSHPILFIGSSSIRNWDLPKSFPEIPTLNRGFGGSELSDSLRYFDRIVLPYQPRAILLYAGDNDIKNGETADQIIADYRSFAAKVREQLPDSHFAFIPIKPSLSRWNLWPEMKKANDAIRLLTASDDHLHFLEIVPPMLGSDGAPRPELFVDDGLHLSEAGYAIWNRIAGAWLKETLK